MFRALLANTPGVVKNLMIINILMFLATLAFGEVMYGNFSLFYFDSVFFKPLGVISHMFMHGGFFHLLVNMFGLWMFGSQIERLWGPKKFLFYFLFTGLGAAALYMGVLSFEVYQATGTITPEWITIKSQSIREIYTTPMVGASGALFGILIAFGMLFPDTKIMLLFFPVPIKAKYFVMMYGAFELYNGLMRVEGDNVAHFAHLGGLLFGFILIKFWQKDKMQFD